VTHPETSPETGDPVQPSRRRLLWGLLASVPVGLGLLPVAAHAERPQIVAVTVTNTDGKPIPNAWVRIPNTEGRRTVDPATGLWEASMLYGYDGEPLVFTRGMVLQISVSAPGYLTHIIEFEVRARRNELPVTLEKMPEQDILPDGLETDEDVLLEWFRSE
jgi:hypothetical protein